MTLEAFDLAARNVGLAVRGAFHPSVEDEVPESTRTLILVGPDEPAFWPQFQSSPEMSDGHRHPLDRWSKRVVTQIASSFGGTALFPYDGPPYAPFLRWAERSGSSWPSPVGLLVHDVAGLFISFRAAVAIPERWTLPAKPQKPCGTCADKPCEIACPVGALAPDQPYDVPKCVAHIKSPEGAACREGCLVRRACPVSEIFGRMPEQSAFHMRAFLGE